MAGAGDKRREASDVVIAPHLQIAIDGPAGSGKTTVAHALAQRLGILYLDTGAMYRAVASEVLAAGLDADNEAAVLRICAMHPIDVRLDAQAPMGFRVFAGTRELESSTLQSNTVSAVVSTIAAHAHVREALVREQRRIALSGPVVMAGRDIGSVVLPDAPVKVYLTATVEARVSRRRAQLLSAGVDVALHQLAREIEERDSLDEHRAVSPLQIAPDAHVIDSSLLSVDEVVARIAALARHFAA